MPFSEAAAAPVNSRPGFDWAALNPLADLQVQNGIKTGLAALLALWIAQALRLEHPNWSVLTVLVLANGRYVGAIATKALVRSVGTVAGALVGIWVVGDYANAPLVFVSLVFVVVAIAAYKGGQLGSAAWPYAYYLVGLVLVAVGTYAITDPGNVWRIGLYRALETLVGVMCGTFVFSLLWPRYSREEFALLARETVKTVRSLLGAEARAYVDEAVDSDRVFDLRREFGRQILKLRALLNSGGRGSSYFQARLGNFQRFVVSMTHLFQALLELQRRRAEEHEILDLVRPEIDRFLAAMDADLALLSDVASPTRGLPPDELNAAFAALETKVIALRKEGVFRRVPMAAAEPFFGHYAALRLLCDELNMTHQLVGELPRLRLPVIRPHKRHAILPAVDRDWARQGVKTGIATCIGFLLLKWIHPPGATAIPLGAWLFSVFGRLGIRSGGTGDLRIFQRMFLTAVTAVPVVALLWVVMPFLSNYWAMNVLLFALCYAFGFVSARSAGYGYYMLIMILGISVLVGINPQEAVAFGTLRDSCLGLMIGVVVGGVVGRVIWPALPQSLVRGNLIRYFENLRGLLEGDGNHDYVLTDTVLLPLEALQAVSAMILPRCPAGERDKLANFIRMSHPLGIEITALRNGKSLPLAAPVENLLREPMAALEVKFDEFLEILALCFRRSRVEIEFPDFCVEIDALDAALTKIRDEGIVATEDMDSVAHMLELADRYHSISERLLACREQIGRLNLHRYLGDVAL